MRIYTALVLGLVFALSTGKPGPARADWRTDLGTFRIGVVAPGNRAEAQRRLEPFRLALADGLGMEVEVFFAKDYATLINAQLASRIEYAVMSTAAYAVTWIQCECIEPLVVPMGADQTKSFRAILISGPQGPSGTQELSPQKVLFPDLGVLGGYSFAAYELAKNGIVTLSSDGSGHGPEETMLKFLENPDHVVLGWSSLTGNPSTGYSRGTLKALASKIRKNVTDYRIIWKSSDIPHPPHIVKRSLPAQVKDLLKDILRPMFEQDPVAYDSIEPVFGGGFATAKQADYALFIDYVRGLVPAKSAAGPSDPKP